jgi:tRNA(His) guanylyltransferase
MSSLGDRMKALEHQTRTVMPRREYMVIRVDGKAFHSYTRGLERPFDDGFIRAMNATALSLCHEVQGAICAYVQSDEISVIATDLTGSNAEPWMGGVHSKVVSISAALATATFNSEHDAYADTPRTALFDSRAFTTPYKGDLYDYLLWRQHDARRNAVGMICDKFIGHKPTVGMKYAERIEQLAERGIRLEHFPTGCIEGRFIWSELVRDDVEYTDKRTGERNIATDVLRRMWMLKVAPDFRDPRHLYRLLPTVPEETL